MKLTLNESGFPRSMWKANRRLLLGNVCGALVSKDTHSLRCRDLHLQINSDAGKSNK